MEGSSSHEPVCVCSGDHLIYVCTVHGDIIGATVWNGTAFSSCLQDEIILPHSQFTSTRGSIGTCNDGDIVGRGLQVEGNNYTSQLYVTITPDTAGKIIVCAYDALTTDSTNDIIQFSTIVPGTHSLCKTIYLTYYIFNIQPHPKTKEKYTSMNTTYNLACNREL